MLFRSEEMDGDEKTGAKIILKALESPLYHIVSNAGLEGSVIVNKVRESEVGVGRSVARTGPQGQRNTEARRPDRETHQARNDLGRETTPATKRTGRTNPSRTKKGIPLLGESLFRVGAPRALLHHGLDVLDAQLRGDGAAVVVLDDLVADVDRPARLDPLDRKSVV